MYLKKLRLKNIKCFEDVTLEFPHTDGDYSGWNVILGENGVGKTAILKAIAVSTLNVFHDGRPARDDRFSVDDRWGRTGQVGRGLFSELQVGPLDHPDHPYKPASRIQHVAGIAIETQIARIGSFPRTNPNKDTGWLATGYGPFRRLSQTAPELRQPYSDTRFKSLFDDNWTMANFINWIPSIYSSSIDDRIGEGHRLLAAKWLKLIIEIVNSVLPDSCQIDEGLVNSREVLFRNSAGVLQDARELSDGYRTFLSVIVDLVQLFAVCVGDTQSHVTRRNGHLEVLVEGIVLIDEADAHLHPSWQRELGERLCKVFPKIQFIVTTHSPFIAQEARDGGLFVLRPTKKGTVEVEQFEESVRGWTATQILTSSLFGLHSTRSVETEKLVRESAELTAKERAGTLTAKEKREFKRVKEQLETRLSAPGETYEEMKRHEDIQKYVADSLKRLNNGKP